MATRTKTVEFAFNVDIATLAAATRRDLAAITLYIPEASPTFLSVTAEVNVRGSETAATSLTSWLIGIKLGAVAFSDVTTTLTLTNSGDQQSFVFTRDITSYFTTNWTGTSMTCQVGMQFGALITANHAVKLYITYSYDDASSSTRIKTVHLPCLLYTSHAKVAGRIALAECKRAIEFLLPVIVFTIGYTASIRTAKMQAIIDAIDAGASGGLNRWYDGVRPATGGSATTLLGTLTFSATCGTAAAGVLTFSAITSDTSADATSTVTWGRVLDSTPTFCFDHSIGTAGGNDIVVNTAAVVTGAQLSITSWTITDGNP